MKADRGGKVNKYTEKWKKGGEYIKQRLKKLCVMSGMLWDIINECPKWRISSEGHMIYTFFRN
jgi:hypothetical protein